MDIELRNKKVTLTKDMVIGSGGEAIIFKDPDNLQTQAIKVYRDSDKFRSTKLTAFFRQNFVLPASVVFPLEPIFKPQSKEVIGFVMKQLENRYRKFMMIFKNSFCQDNNITTKVKIEMFRQMLKDLAAIHAQGFVIGDFNENNQMINDKTNAVAWIDTDSWQFGQFPCIAFTQLYLNPDLYGVDLSKKPMFKPIHDWWSYTVILTCALLNGVHPFRSGDHPQWKSVMSRAQNGATVFDQDVDYPDVGLPPEVLTDELIDQIVKILKRKENIPFPEKELINYGELLTECKSCRMWYPATRQNCPSCKKKTILDVQMRAKIAGLEIIDLLTVKGKIINFQIQGVRIYCLAVEKGMIVLYRKDGDNPFVRIEVADYNVSMELSIFNDTLVVCPEPTSVNPALYIVDVKPGGKIKPIDLTTTKTFAGGQAVYGTTKRFLYRIAERMLISTERDGDFLLDRPVTQVFNEQTWFTAYADEESYKEYIFGFDRLFGDFKWFLIIGDAKTKKFIRREANVSSLQKKETILETDVKFSATQILLVRKTRLRGNDLIRLDVLNTSDGSLDGAYLFKQDAIRPDEIFGKAFENNIVLHPTNKGIAKENLKDGLITIIPGTDKYVKEQDRLFPYENGVLVVKENSLVLLKPNK